MDPNVTLAQIDEYLKEEANPNTLSSPDWAKDSAEDLLEWLAKGGFEPDWGKYPEAANYVTEERYKR